MQSHPIDGDGLRPDVFKYLCRVNALSGDNAELAFRLPDTIVFSNCASFWYCTDNTSHIIHRRPARDLDRSTIFDVFTGAKRRRSVNAPICDVIAQWVEWGPDGLRAEYLTKDALREFLFGPRRERHGILQRFVEPKDRHNHAIQVVWSPEMTFAVRRVNRHNVFDLNLPPATRCATFDGDAHACHEQFCPPHFREAMGAVCRSLVDFFHAADGRFHIGRCVAFFKQDADDVVWLQFTTSARVVEGDEDLPRGAPKLQLSATSAGQIPHRPLLEPLRIAVHPGGAQVAAHELSERRLDGMLDVLDQCHTRLSLGPLSRLATRPVRSGMKATGGDVRGQQTAAVRGPPTLAVLARHPLARSANELADRIRSAGVQCAAALGDQLYPAASGMGLHAAGARRGSAFAAQRDRVNMDLELPGAAWSFLRERPMLCASTVPALLLGTRQGHLNIDERVTASALRILPERLQAAACEEERWWQQLGIERARSCATEPRRLLMSELLACTASRRAACVVFGDE